MTDNIKPTVQEKTAWTKVPQEFNDWWNSDYSDESNPFRINSAAYWAWAGWSEAVRLNAQAVPAAPQPAQQPLTDDPCPGCQVGKVCRTPKCGRLKLPTDHPLRTGVKND